MNPDLIGSLVRLVLALPVVLGLAYLVLKYGLGRRYAVVSGSRRMKLVEQLPLGPKATLSLVSLGGRYYLLAHQENSISLIKELGHLPEPAGARQGEIRELTPQTLDEINRLQDAGPPGGAGRFSDFRGRCRDVWLFLAGRAAHSWFGAAARLTGRPQAGEKGEKSIEG